MTVKIDLSRIADLAQPTWLEAIELRRQAGMSTTAMGVQLQRLPHIPEGTDVLDDVDLMTAMGAALWLLARRDGETCTYAEFVGVLTLQDLADAVPAAPDPAPVPTRAPRAPRARKPK